MITDAGMNDLIRPALYQAHHEILPVKQASGAGKANGKVDVVGPVCESGRLFCPRSRAGSVKPGDLVLILDAGAYGMSLSSNYNTRSRPAEVLVEGSEARLIRRRETMKDLLQAGDSWVGIVLSRAGGGKGPGLDWFATAFACMLKIDCRAHCKHTQVAHISALS